MNNQEEKLKHFIDDAIFLEKNKLKIECELKTLKEKTENESKRSEYRISEKTESLGDILTTILIYVIVMLIIRFIVVPVIHFVILDIIIAMFRGFKAMPPCKAFDIACNTIFGILLFIPVLLTIWRFIKEKVEGIRENKEKTIHDEKEEQRLQHFNNIIMPKIKNEEKQLKKEYNIYDSEIQQLYELDVIPMEYCNLEAINVMQEYISKYKVTDKKHLLNACDKYFQYKDLKHGVQNAQERLEYAQRKVIESFEDMAYSMESKMDSLMMKMESQNYDLERLQERTEREKRNSELLLYWNLIN